MLFDNDDIAFLQSKETKKAVKKAKEYKEIEYGPYSEEGLVRMHKVIPLEKEKYSFFTREHFEHSLNFYDFEIFMFDWMVTIVNPLDLTKTIIVNNRDALRDYYNDHCNEFFVGYNSKHYDVPIFKGIYFGLNPKKVNDDIVYRDVPGWKIDERFRKMRFLDFDIKVSDNESLKQLEAFMGDDIQETSVPFDIERKLTKKEILESVKYNMHDVDETVEVFKRRISEYDAYTNLMETFDLPLTCISQTKAQMTATILECESVQNRGDEFDLQIVPTLRVKKYKKIVDWFRNPDNMSYSKGLGTQADFGEFGREWDKSPILVCGVPHTFGWGGLHGCIGEPNSMKKDGSWKSKPVTLKGRIFHVDVTSYYPSMMIEYRFLTRNCRHPEKFKIIYDTRVALKNAGKKKEQAPYKIVLNGTYGICKDRNNSAYDPRQANNICVNGQLMLLDLLEHLEPYIELIQSNTDGLIIRIPDNDEAEAKFLEVCKEWEDRTKMGLGKDKISKISQKDVNNYVFEFANGKLERKGSYTQETSDLSNDLPIINEALVQYLIHNVSVEDTINNCNELIKFQKVVRLQGAFHYGWHNSKFSTNKTYRAFASKNKSDSFIGRCRDMDETVMKFGNTPDHCFLDNSNIKGKVVPSNLDRQWYIDLAKKRLEDYGVQLSDSTLLL